MPRELPAWGEEDLLAFLAWQRETKLGSLWHVSAYTGMRRGEVLGLQRGDIDLDAATITLRRTRVPVKGDGRSKPGRIITSSAKTKRIRVIDLDPRTVEVLRTVTWSTVFPTDIIEQDAAASRWVFSDAAGEPLNIVSARLGHADPIITMTVYAHCLPRAQQATVAVLESMGAERAR